MNVSNKLECLFLASLSSLAWYLWIRAVVHLIVDHHSDAPHGQALV
jgi:hypothetical protein